MSNLVKLNLFGELGAFIGSESWELDVKSVQEAISAINTITRNKFNEYFIKNNKLQAKYRILINGRDFDCTEKELNETNYQKIYESELVMKKKDLKTIDIVPLIESAGGKGFGILTAILGALMIIVGIILIATGFGAPIGIAVIIGGLGLLGAGVVSLLSKPPSFNYNQPLDNSVSHSYLFNGPSNTIGEGNPVPIGYGTVLVGSNVISAGYRVDEFQTENK